MQTQITRRAFLAATSAASVAALLTRETEAKEPIIDIHQHTHYSGRTDRDLLKHQQKMGIAKTVLLPAGSKYGLEADAWGNETCLALVKKYPKQYYFFANELPDITETKTVLEKYLKLGAIGIGEQKYMVDCDSPQIELLASIAKEFSVPILMHFQYGKYNTGYERFHKILAKFPNVNFIGHAQTFWANIDKNHEAPVLYPKTKVTAGGYTDRYLADYPNMFADLSAGSGLNAMQRDEEQAREFIVRHQDKLLYGSDCNDVVGFGEKCSGAQQIAEIRKLITDKKILQKIFYDNASRVLKIK